MRGWVRTVGVTVPLALAWDGAAQAAYWNVFNFEGENVASAVIVTEATLTDMLNDTNRTGTFNPGGAADNVVSSGASGRHMPPPMGVPEPRAIGLVGAALATLARMGPRRRAA